MITREEAIARIERLTQEREQFVQNANMQIARMDGMIHVYQQMIADEDTPDRTQEQDATGD